VEETDFMVSQPPWRVPIGRFVGLVLLTVLLYVLVSTSILTAAGPALAGSCDPRPPVRLTTTADQPGRLAVVVTAGAGSLQRVQFGLPVNGAVDVLNGPSDQRGSFIYAPPAGSTSVSFVARQISPSSAMTIPLVAVDDCGTWPTFVGGGIAAWVPTSTPTRTPSPTLTPTVTSTPTASPTPTLTPTPRPCLRAPSALAVNPANTRLYVVNVVPLVNELCVIDVATNALVTAIPLGGSTSSGVAVMPDNSRVYVSNSSSNEVVVVDADTNVPGTHIPLGSMPERVILNPAGTRGYVSQGDINDPAVDVIDTARNVVETRITEDPSICWAGWAGSRSFPMPHGCTSRIRSSGISSSSIRLAIRLLERSTRT